jgi:hypothetical protein
MSATDTSPSLSTPPTPDGPAAAAAKAVELIAQQYRDAIAGLQAIMPLRKYDSRQTRRIAASAKFAPGLIEPTIAMVTSASLMKDRNLFNVEEADSLLSIVNSPSAASEASCCANLYAWSAFTEERDGALATVQCLHHTTLHLRQGRGEARHRRVGWRRLLKQRGDLTAQLQCELRPGSHPDASPDPGRTAARREGSPGAPSGRAQNRRAGKRRRPLRQSPRRRNEEVAPVYAAPHWPGGGRRFPGDSFGVPGVRSAPLSESATASYREQPLDAFCRRDSLSEDFVFPKTKDSPTHRLKFARPFDIPLPVRNAFGVPVGCVRGGCTTIAA